jgi:DNA-binding NarL/FixJ family response regulator
MTLAKKIQVLLVDDQNILRESLRTVLQSYPNIKVVGEARDGEEAVLYATKLQPDAVVMDINMPRMDGITATRLIKAQCPTIAVVGLSVNTKDYKEHAMRKAGAFEVLTKDSAVVELFGAIQRAVADVQPVVILEEGPDAVQASHHPSPSNTSTEEPKI